MAAPPDDLTSWRPDDGLDSEDWYDEFVRINKETEEAVSLGMMHREYLALPKPRRDMLLQRRCVPRKAR